MQVRVIKACGHDQVFDCPDDEPMLAQKLSRFKATRCIGCVVKLELEKKEDAFRRKADNVRRQLGSLQRAVNTFREDQLAKQRAEFRSSRLTTAMTLLTAMHCSPMYREMSLAGKVHRAITAADALLAQLERR